MKPQDIQTLSVFEDLLPIDNATLSGIVEDMKEHGYDPAYPVVIWREKGVLIDGHTRLLAARHAGVPDIPVVPKFFADEDEAVMYAVHAQRDRRNLTDGDILRLIAEVDRRNLNKFRGNQHTAVGERNVALTTKASRKSAAQTASIVGVSPRKVEQARTVRDHATEDLKKQIHAGSMSINRAYNEVRKERTARGEDTRRKPAVRPGDKPPWNQKARPDRWDPPCSYRTWSAEPFPGATAFQQSLESALQPVELEIADGWPTMDHSLIIETLESIVHYLTARSPISQPETSPDRITASQDESLAQPQA